MIMVILNNAEVFTPQNGVDLINSLFASFDIGYSKQFPQ